MQGIVYVLSNPAMPGLVKIGMTERSGYGQRLAELYSTGVPEPFRCEFAYMVSDAADIEASLHRKFDNARPNQYREFFAIDAREVREALEEMPGSECTDEVESAMEANVKKRRTQEIRAARDLTQAPKSEQRAKPARTRRPNLNFVEMGIPIGAEIVSVTTGESAEIVSPRRILFRGTKTSLWAASQLTTGRRHPGPPTAEWLYNSESIGDLYVKTYGPYLG